MTDPNRINNCLAAAKNLPEGAAVIYRHFGKSERKAEAEALRQITFQKNQQLLIGADPLLAIKIGADGVHFRRADGLSQARLWKKRCPDWIITMAGFKPVNIKVSGNKQESYKQDLSCLDGLFISPVFESQSPSAGPPIGIAGLKAAVANLDTPVFALGGINQATAAQLIGSGAAGLAGVSGVLYALCTIGGILKDNSLVEEAAGLAKKFSTKIKRSLEIYAQNVGKII